MDNLYEAYLDVYQELDELYKGKHGQSDAEYQADRSPAGKRFSGDKDTGPRYYTLGRARGATVDPPTAPGARPVGTPKLAQWEKDDIQYRKANLRAGKVHKVGGPKGLPEEEEFDLFDYLLEYLVAEGYANTNENAIAIMANMSEDWRESIVEGAVEITPQKRDFMLRQKSKLVDSGKVNQAQRVNAAITTTNLDNSRAKETENRERGGNKPIANNPKPKKATMLSVDRSNETRADALGRKYDSAKYLRNKGTPESEIQSYLRNSR